MNPILASTPAAGRHRRLPSCGQLVAGMMIALTSACSGPPLAPATPPTLSLTAPPEPSGSPIAIEIERHEPVVKPGNVSSLNDAAVPFATYLDTMHQRLHPIFAEELATFDSRPQAPARGDDLITVLEIVLSPAEGRIEKIGVIKTSGVTAFDVASLSSVSRAQPFGKAPDIIISADAKVYLRWELHRHPTDACSTRNAFPFLLK